jgi:hypothetical protein
LKNIASHKRIDKNPTCPWGNVYIRLFEYEILDREVMA